MLLALSLLGLAGRVGAAEPALEVGFAETDITPEVNDRPVYLAGFGHNRKATGVHDPLRARAAVLLHDAKKIALVSVDLVGFFLPSVERVRAQAAGFSYVLVSSTHNHEGPDTLGLWGPSPLQSGVDPDYLRLVERRAADAVRAADAARRPVTARVGTARSPELLHDAREPIVKHDELTAIAFHDPAGKPAGLVVNWHCHPETLESQNTRISADFVGYTVAALRERHRCPVVYLTGTVGGLMTSMHVDVRDRAGKPLAAGSHEKTARYGELVADLAGRALAGAGPARLTPFDVRSRPLFLPLDNQLYVLARQLGVFDRSAYIWAGNSRQAERAGPAPGAKPLCLRTELALLRLGEVDIAAIPGEIYPELVLGKIQNPPDPGADFPEALPEPAIYTQLRGRHRLLVGLANDEIGYIIPKRQWDAKAPFCYGRKKAQYGEANSLGPETAPLLCEAFRELAAK
jgi:hypothetical protein